MRSDRNEAVGLNYQASLGTRQSRRIAVTPGIQRPYKDIARLGRSGPTADDDGVAMNLASELSGEHMYLNEHLYLLFRCCGFS